MIVNISPPQWPLKILRLFLKPEFLEEIEGDMEEIFQDLSQDRSARYARWIYRWEVLRLMRPGLLKHLQFNHPLNFKDMARHNFLIIVRNFMRYKTTFFINLFGFTLGIACVLLALIWTRDELKMDKFHAQDAQLYQIMNTVNSSNGSRTIVSTPALLADALVEEHPEVINAVEVIPSAWLYEPGVLVHEDKAIRSAEQYVGENFFELFSFPLLAGNPDQILQTKKEILLSDDIAKKLFGTTTDLIGKSIEWKHEEHTGQYVISGVFEQPGKYATMQFDVLFHIDLFLEAFTYLDKWPNNEPSTFVLLAEDVDPVAYGEKVSTFLGTKIENTSNRLLLQQYSDRYLNGHYENGQIAGGRITNVKLFSIIILFILVIAGINFINLSTAQASRRAKEIGVKKAIGIHPSALMWQYLGEALLLSLFAFITAVGLVALVLPAFNSIIQKQLSLDLDLNMWALALGLTFLIGLLSGIYPAFFLSQMKPLKILKGVFKQSEGSILARKSLVVFQFALSILLILASFVIFQQSSLIQSKELGYDRNNLIYFSNDG
ncbi:MAG: ABC transporter permease, partial [Bacteroidota bacterium]